MCLVLFGVVQQRELYLTSSVLFGQNSKTPLRLVTSSKVWINFASLHLFNHLIMFDRFVVFRLVKRRSFIGLSKDQEYCPTLVRRCYRMKLNDLLRLFSLPHIGKSWRLKKLQCEKSLNTLANFFSTFLHFNLFTFFFFNLSIRGHI